MAHVIGQCFPWRLRLVEVISLSQQRLILGSSYPSTPSHLTLTSYVQPRTSRLLPLTSYLLPLTSHGTYTVSPSLTVSSTTISRIRIGSAVSGFAASNTRSASFP